MKSRAALFVAAIVASIFSSANAFAAPDDAAADNAAADKAEQPVEQCLTSPREYTPPGTRWRYRLERGTGRHCWFLKHEAEKSAGKAAGQSAAAAGEPAPAPSRKRPATARSVSDARAELSQPAQPAPGTPAPAAGAPVGNTAQPPATRSANMPAPAAATRWPEPMSTLSQASPAANPPAAPAEQSGEARTAQAATPPAKPQVMPRAVPPMPLSEKPLSTPMLITIIVGGLSVLGVMVSLLFAWIASRRARRSPRAAMPPLEMPDQPRRPGDLYRERKRLRAQKTRRRAA